MHSIQSKGNCHSANMNQVAHERNLLNTSEPYFSGLNSGVTLLELNLLTSKVEASFCLLKG